MNTSLFIVGAYGITGALLLALCMATWLSARRVKRHLALRGES